MKVLSFFNTVINYIGSIYPEAEELRRIIFLFLGFMSFHTGIYFVIGFFFTRKFKETENFHKYAILIAARNEEAVIGNLLESIKRQDYPKEYLTVFVVADNCDDKTADISRENGAVCYERFDDKHRTKGYALQFLFENIKRDYGIENFEGYFIFDADNLLNSDYITRMNEAFDSGEKIITSYRNSKNFDENWVASTYAIHWLRSIRQNHRARSVLRLATNIQGTGFLFANELVRDGWKYTSLTEDRAFTADAVTLGYPITYCDAAMFYDEQPTSIRVALRQRLRWSKGHLQAFFETGPTLFKNIFRGCGKIKGTKLSKMQLFAEGIRARWASYDTLAQVFPKAVVRLFVWLLVSVFIKFCSCYSLGISVAAKTTATVFALNIINRLRKHICTMPVAIYVLFTERKRIKKIPIRKKILCILTWPVFDAIKRWTTYIAIFKRVEWKPIPHKSTVTIEQLDKTAINAKENFYEKA